jgi:hypothetical protein
MTSFDVYGEQATPQDPMGNPALGELNSHQTSANGINTLQALGQQEEVSTG